jgi:hypothetical protein
MEARQIEDTINRIQKEECEIFTVLLTARETLIRRFERPVLNHLRKLL